MSARRSLALAALLLAGCSKTSARPGIRLSGPSAVAVFHAFTSRDPANLRSYLAVANEHGDDLRLLDAVDGKAVLAPGLIQALSVPTAPRPALLAAGGLQDVSAGPDLLAVAPRGLVACGVGPSVTSTTVFSGCIQVIDTWSGEPAVDRGQPADPVHPIVDPTIVVGLVAGGEDAEVLSLVVVPVPSAPGGAAVPGQARLVAGLSGGRLLLADFVRDPDGVTVVRSGDPVIHQLGFDLVALSGSPDGSRLYAASTDPVHALPVPAGDLEGVAELDLSAPIAQVPAVRALDVGAPTTAVLAATVRPFSQVTSDPRRDELGPPVTRVYAAVEPTRCGRDRQVACGVVTIDPATGGPAGTGGLLADPSGELPAWAPMAVPGLVSALAAVYPPAYGSGALDGTVLLDGTAGPLQKQATLVSDRWTSTLAVATSSNGSTYLLDLARGALARETAVLPAVLVAGASASDPPSAGQPHLGLWDDEGTLAQDSASLPKRVAVTPGYTSADSWVVGFQTAVSNLSSVRAQVQSGAAGPTWVALQYTTGAAADAGPYRGVVRLYDPRLGVRVGDILVVAPTGAAATAACPLGAFELEVTDFLLPSDPGDPAGPYPGGALAVTPRAPEDQPKVTVGGVEVPADPHCLDGTGRTTAVASVLSRGLHLQGTVFGYAGRPEARANSAEAAYELKWTDTSALSCAMLDSQAWPPAPCDAACRDACDQVLLARKARRGFYVSEQCDPGNLACVARWGSVTWLAQTGPVLRFKPGWVYAPGTIAPLPPARGTFLLFNSVSGEVATTRRPLSGGSVVGAVLPSGLATFDRTAVTRSANEGVRVFVSYPANEVLDFSPGLPAASSTLHR